MKEDQKDGYISINCWKIHSFNANTAKGGGISRKFLTRRKKIRKALNEIIILKEMGIIVRTAGSNKTKNEIENDLKNLIKVWDQKKIMLSINRAFLDPSRE